MQPGRCSVSGVTGVPEATVLPAVINKITSPSELSTFYYVYYPYYPIYSMCQDSGVYNVYRTWPAAVPSKIKQWYLYLSSIWGWTFFSFNISVSRRVLRYQRGNKNL